MASAFLLYNSLFLYLCKEQKIKTFEKQCPKWHSRRLPLGDANKTRTKNFKRFFKTVEFYPLEIPNL